MSARFRAPLSGLFSLVVLAACSGGGGGTTTAVVPVVPGGGVQPAGPGALSVSMNVSGAGSITSMPSGITCGTTCSATFAAGTSVTLTETPAAGYQFSTWGGACTAAAANSTCVVNGGVATSVTAFFVPIIAGNDLCSGSITDKNAHPMTTMAKPPIGSFTEPEFPASIIWRITDVQGTTGSVGVNAPMYSTVPAWNADESYLILYQTQGFSGSGLQSKYLLYNGKRPYNYIKDLPIGPADVEDAYWSSSDPQTLYYITDYGYPNGNFDPVLIAYNVGADSHTVLHHFLVPAVNQVDFGHILYMSWDNSLVGIRDQAGDPNIYTESYNIKTGTDNGWHFYNDAAHYQGLQVAPSGKAAIIGSQVLDPVTQQLIRNMSTDTEEHGALGMLANGDDAWVSSQYGSTAFPNVLLGNIVVEDLQTGTVTPIVAPANGWLGYPAITSHISTFAFKNPGWVANSIVGDNHGQNLLDEEILLANVNTGGVCRVAHHHSYGSDPSSGLGAGPQGYWAEPHVVISPSGTRMLFGSDWGGTASVDAYIVELPTYKP